MSTSTIQLAANRENAQHSTGPRTPQGKQRSSLNATRHGLTSQVVVLPHEDMQAYLAFHQEALKLWAPRGVLEQRLVQRLVDTEWRVNRCPSLEHGLFAAGPNQPLEIDTETDPENLDTQAILNAARVLRENYQALESLGRHEARLSRLYQSTLKELKETQQQRGVLELGEMLRAATLYKTSKMKGVPNDPAVDGFVWNNAEIEAWIVQDNRQIESLRAANVHFNLAQFQRMSAAA